ncbi:hypothetical protein GGI12_004531 [Dipsacomyces acuminosporus]|nr:hypothetical protein GGI12_004531 [Dipsacomyces acuminosporus]
MRAIQATALFLLSTVAFATVATAADTFEVYHNPNAVEFVQRGEVRVHEDGTATYQPISLHHPPSLANVGKNAKDPAKYTVILRSAKTGSQHAVPIKRCRLNGGGKPEETFVLFETEKGDVFHIDYGAGKSDNCAKSKPASELDFSTKVRLEKRVDGAFPKLAFAANINAMTGKEQKPEEQKSFFVKYWYYIVPMVLMLLLSGGEEPQQEGNSRR